MKRGMTEQDGTAGIRDAVTNILEAEIICHWRASFRHWYAT
jgi:hypothetical protein